VESSGVLFRGERLRRLPCRKPLRFCLAESPLGFVLAESGFAASRAESLWLSVSSLIQMRLRLGGAAAKRIAALTESQRLSARKAAKPENHPKGLSRRAWGSEVYLDESTSGLE